MAELTFVLTDTNGQTLKAENILSYELSRDEDAACDGLRVTLLCDSAFPEIDRVEVYAKDKRIFNGLCDTQRETADADGSTVFLYARSTACVLVDNEAEPAVFYAPTAASLIHFYAKAYGFQNGLPTVCSTHEYAVSKGVSCYSAISRFVQMLTGKCLRVTPDNVLVLAESNRMQTLNKYTVLSVKRTVNRGEAISVADYKTDGDIAYCRHLKSRGLEAKGIQRCRKVNVAGLPQWQRAYTLHNLLQTAADRYQTAEVVLDGCHPLEVSSRIQYHNDMLGSLDGYVIGGVCLSMNVSQGTRTQLKLYKPTDLEEICYVAE